MDAQDVGFTLAVAAMILALLLLAHLAVILLYKRFVSRELHPYLQLPRMETILIGGFLGGLGFTFFLWGVLAGWRAADL